MEEFVKLLVDLQSKDNPVRDAAERTYETALARDPGAVVNHLVALLVSSDGTRTDLVSARVFSAVLFNKVILGNQSTIWKKLDLQTRLRATSEIISAFEREQDEKMQRRLAICTSQVATAIDRAGEEPFWPDMFPCLMRIIRQGTPTQQAAGINCIGECAAIRPIKKLIQENSKAFGEVLELAFKSSYPQVKKEGCVLVCLMIEKWDSKKIKILEVTLNPMLGILKGFAEGNFTDEAAELLQGLEAATHANPQFFEPIFASLMEVMGEFVALRNVLDDEVRRLALEVLVSCAQSSERTKPKHVWRSKNVMPQFPFVALSACMEMMCDITEAEQWSTLMDDEGDDEDQENFTAGENGIDRVVEALSMDHCQDSVVRLIQQYVNRAEWEAKHAALHCIRQCIEYVDEKKIVNEMAELLFQHIDNPNKRLRYVAWMALAQLSSDQAPHFQEKWHARLMPSIVRSIEQDPELRVQQMCLSCFVSFGEELDNTDMEIYAHTMMALLGTKIMSISHRGVREEAITSIAVIAGVIEKDFAKYYDKCLEILSDCIMHCAEPQEGRLRGKAFECMSLLGHTVGPERFREDARAALEEMCSTYQGLQTDDIQKDYIKEAMERVCRILKGDFSPYLQFVVPPLLETMDVKQYATPEAQALVLAESDDDDEAGMTITYNKEEFGITEGQLAEMEIAASQLAVMIKETGAGYYPEVEKTGATLDPWLERPSEVVITSRADRVRESIFECWSGMVKDCHDAAKQGDGNQAAVTLGNRVLRRFFETVAQIWTTIVREIADEGLTVDPDDVRLYAVCLADCFKGAVNSQGGISDNEIVGLLDLIFKILRALISQQRKARNSERDEEDEEEGLCANLACVSVIGGMMQYSPRSFQGEPLAKIGQFLVSLDSVDAKHDTTESTAPKPHSYDTLLLLTLGAQAVEHLGEASFPMWNVLVRRMQECLHHNLAEVRQAAARLLYLCARWPSFDSNIARNAHDLVVAVVLGQKKFPKRRDDSSRIAIDKMVAALLQLAISHEGVCGANTWDHIFVHLPLVSDVDEGAKVHAEILRLLKCQHAGMLGTNNCRTAKVLGMLSEVYRGDGTPKELSDDIRETFLLIPKENLQAMAHEFKDKQKKKIERVMKGV